jgi:pimeloyl-ACP methyl ester carboxylesterase
MTVDISRRTILGRFGLGGLGTALIALPLSELVAKSAPLPPRTVILPVAAGRTSRVTHWQARVKRGTILFSHGALSSPLKYDPLILPWVAAGFDVWAPLHVDSTDHPDTKSFPGLTSWRARIEDMRALSNHVGGSDYIAAGHSYGGLTALMLGGAEAIIPDGVTGPLRDPKAKAVVAFSPPGANPGLIDGAGYAGLAVPALIETGTKDTLPARNGMAVDPASWKNHLLAYDSAAPGHDRYALVLDGVDHYFGGLICSPEKPGPRQTVQLDQAVALSLNFINGYGAGSKRAIRALNSRLSDNGPVVLRKK